MKCVSNMSGEILDAEEVVTYRVRGILYEEAEFKAKFTPVTDVDPEERISITEAGLEALENSETLENSK